MKKLLFIAFMLLLTIKIFSQDSVIIENIAPNAIQIPDSAKLTLGKVYNDVKARITGLASALKVGAEHVYHVLVKQQFVFSITLLIVYVVVGLISYFTIQKGRKVLAADEYDDSGGIITGLGIGIGIVGVIVFLATISDVVMGFVNPEYGAIKEILEFVR